MPSTNLKPYTLEQLSSAIADWNHAKGELAQLLKELAPKRASVASLERQEGELLCKVEAYAAVVRRVSKALE